MFFSPRIPFCIVFDSNVEVDELHGRLSLVQLESVCRGKLSAASSVFPGLHNSYFYGSHSQPQIRKGQDDVENVK